MNTTPILAALALGAALGGGATFAATSKTWDAFYNPPGVESLTFAASACDASGDCLLRADMVASPNPTDAATVGNVTPRWPEVVRVKATAVQALLTAGCVEDDTARPKGFAQTIAACAGKADVPDAGP